MSEPKPVWEIHSQIEPWKSHIKIDGRKIPVKSMDFHQDAATLLTLRLTMHPRHIELLGDYAPEITIAPFWPDCKHELRKLIIGKATGTPRYTYMGCICKVKE